MKRYILLLLAGSTLSFSALAADIDWSKLPPAATNQNLTFSNDIAPIFKTACVRCHGAEHPRDQLRLDTLEGVLKGTKVGPILTAGNSADSLLVKAVSQLDQKTAMPPKRRMRPGGQGGPGGPPPGGEMPPPPMNGPEGTNAAGTPPRNFGPPPKPLTAEQVGIIRAWIDQGAK